MNGDRLRQRRIMMGIRIRELSAKTGVSTQHIRDIERGRREPSTKTLLLLQDLLALSTCDWLSDYLAEENRPLLLIQMAEQMFQRGDYTTVLVILKRLRSLQAHVRHGQRNQGRIYRLWGAFTFHECRFARSLIWFKRAERAVRHSRDFTKIADASYNTALAMMKTGFLSQAIAKFREAITTFEALGEHRKAAYARLTIANTLLEMQSYREALPMYRRAASELRGDPWYFDCKLGEAICLWRTQSPKSALKKLLGVAKFAADADRQARFHHNVGVIYRQLGALDDAIAHLTMALGVCNNQARPESFAELSLCRTLVGDFSGARDALERFVAYSGAKDPQDVLSMAILSKALLQSTLPESLPRYVTDGYEQRIAAAVAVLQS